MAASTKGRSAAGRKKATFDVSLEDLLEAGAHFGHQVRRWNPKMKPYIFDAREGIHIFDLARTREALLEAAEAVKKTVAEGGVVLFVGTKRQARELVAVAAQKVGMPYFTNRWPGGFLTNFEQIERSIKKMVELKQSREAGEFKTYTKRERLLIDRRISKLERAFGGVQNVRELPNMLFVVDTKKEATAVKEAVKKGLAIVGIVDTNADPTLVDWPIPANDDAVKSISVILDVVVGAIEEGKKKAKTETDS